MNDIILDIFLYKENLKKYGVQNHYCFAHIGACETPLRGTMQRIPDNRWIKYFHKHAKITEKSIFYLDEDYFHDKPAIIQLLTVNC